MRAGVVAQLADLRVHAAAALARSRPEQPHARFAPQRRVLLVARQLAVREREHRVPLGDRLVDLLLVLEDLGQQPVGLDALGFERLRPFRLDDRVGGEVVLEQHLRQPQVAAHRRAHALAQRRPGRARFVLLADLELRLAEADDRRSRSPGSSLCSRCQVLSARRSSPEREASVGELLERGPVAARSARWPDRRRRRPPRGDRAASAVRSRSTASWESSGRRRTSSSSVAVASSLVAELVEQGDDAAPDLDVARRGGQRGARGRRARPRDRPARRAPARARPIRRGPARVRARRASSGRVPRLRATANATVQTARRRSASPGGSSRSSAVSVAATRAPSPGSPLAMRRRAARSASSSFAAACPGRSRASSTAAAAAGLPARSRASARRAAISSRSGSTRASSRSSAIVLSCARLVGCVARAGQDRERARR